MATVSNLASMGYSSTSSNSIKSKISAVQDELKGLSQNKNLSSEERTKLQEEYQEKLSGLRDELSSSQDASLASIQNNASGLLGFGGGNSLFGTNTDNASGINMLLTAGNTLSSLNAVNSARVGIENRARTLNSEIKMDRARGINTSGKEEALSNLTSNLEIMNTNLNGNIEKTLSKEESSSKDSRPIIDQIKQQLEANQKVVEKKVTEKYNPTAAEETE